jgi:hypothetical protein
VRRAVLLALVLFGCASEPAPQPDSTARVSSGEDEPEASARSPDVALGHLVENQILELARLDTCGLDEVAAVLSASEPHGNEVKDFRHVPAVYQSISYWRSDEWIFIRVSLASPAPVELPVLKRLLELLEGSEAKRDFPQVRGGRREVFELGGKNWRHGVQLWFAWDQDATRGRIMVDEFEMMTRVKPE